MPEDTPGWDSSIGVFVRDSTQYWYIFVDALETLLLQWHKWVLVVVFHLTIIYLGIILFKGYSNMSRKFKIITQLLFVLLVSLYVLPIFSILFGYPFDDTNFAILLMFIFSAIVIFMLILEMALHTVVNFCDLKNLHILSKFRELIRVRV